jgi:hypothetical protein
LKTEPDKYMGINPPSDNEGRDSLDERSWDQIQGGKSHYNEPSHLGESSHPEDIFTLGSVVVTTPAANPRRAEWDAIIAADQAEAEDEDGYPPHQEPHTPIGLFTVFTDSSTSKTHPLSLR